MGVPAARQAGFTLIEVMVVVVLIGIIVSFATLSVSGSGDREAEQEARRLAALIGLANEESVLKSRETGVLFTPDGYSFVMLGADGLWTPLTDEVFRARTLPAGFSLKLAVDGLPVDIDEPREKPKEKPKAEKKPDEDEEKPDEEDQLKPHVFLFSDGERTSFEVDLGVIDGVRYRVTAPALGDLQVSGVDDS